MNMNTTAKDMVKVVREEGITAEHDLPADAVLLVYKADAKYHIEIWYPRDHLDPLFYTFSTYNEQDAIREASSIIEDYKERFSVA